MFGIGRKEKLTPEQELTKKQIEMVRGQIKELKRLRSREDMERVRKNLGFVLKHTFPKGIRYPDSLVRNIHLYKPIGGKHKTILK